MKRDERTIIEEVIKEVRAELLEATSLLNHGVLATVKARLRRVCNLIVVVLISPANVPPPTKFIPSKQTDLINDCIVTIGLARDGQRCGAIRQAQEYLVKLRELLNNRPELEAGGSLKNSDDGPPIKQPQQPTFRKVNHE